MVVRTLSMVLQKLLGNHSSKNIHNVTDYINEGTITLADIKLNIIPTAEAYDIEIPEINVVYTHMLGSNCHFIIAGRNLAATMIETLEGYLDKNYNLILTSHYIPEDINAVKVKIAYIKRLLTIAETSYNAKEMIDKVKMNIMVVLNYLEMTAHFENTTLIRVNPKQLGLVLKIKAS